MTDAPSEPELPDDCDRWPSDARTLFGLAPEATRRDLKRSYSKLIRRFKPEHAQEQFRRLREAFEELDQQFEWRELFNQRFAESLGTDQIPTTDSSLESGKQRDVASDSPEPVSLNPFDVNQRRANAGTDERTGLTVEETSATSRDADQIWQRGLDGGDLKLMYHALTQPAAGGPRSDIDYARLYWILILCPECDSIRDPCDWLIDGIRQIGSNNRLPVILSLDVRRRSGNVPALLAMDLLDNGHSADRLVELLQIRWLVARHCGEFDIIVVDIGRLQRRFLDEPLLWQQLLCAAIRCSVFSRSLSAETTLAFVQNEFEQTSSEMESNWLWDWYEATIVLHEAWSDDAKSLLSVNAGFYRVLDIYGRADSSSNLRTKETLATFHQLLGLIEDSWECPASHARSNVVSFCQRLTSNPDDAFADLAVLTQHKRPLVIRLLELIREHISDNNPEEYSMTSAAETIVQKFVLDELRSMLYWQPTIAHFCLDEGVTPTDIANTIERLHQKLPHFCMELAASIRSDLPITCIVEAQRLLWQSPP